MNTKTKANSQYTNCHKQHKYAMKEKKLLEKVERRLIFLCQLLPESSIS